MAILTFLLHRIKLKLIKKEVKLEREVPLKMNENQKTIVIHLLYIQFKKKYAINFSLCSLIDLENRKPQF